MDGGSAGRSAEVETLSWPRAESGARPVSGAHADRATRFLPPGQIAVSGEPTAVTSILGSCVAVCITDPIARVGGLTHYLLPSPLGCRTPEHYGTLAVPLLIERVIALGGRRGRLEAKVFGGARMIGTPQARREHVGERNSEIAFELLKGAGIPILAEDVGGTRARKLIYYTDDATAWVRRL